MPNASRSTCKRCHRHRSEVGPISWLGNCEPCGEVAMNENVDQMHDRRGPNWNAWRLGMIRSAGGTVTDPRLLV